MVVDCDVKTERECFDYLRQESCQLISLQNTMKTEKQLGVGE